VAVLIARSPASRPGVWPTPRTSPRPEQGCRRSGRNARFAEGCGQRAAERCGAGRAGQHISGGKSCIASSGVDSAATKPSGRTR
jgi:hypothetical protein